jgi:hypothetical protein
MAGKQINFTKKTIEALPSPTKSVRAYYHDTKETGLSVSVTRVCSKTFFVRKRIDGADECITLGRYPDLSMENARKLTAKTKGSIAMGKNPQAEKRTIRYEITYPTPERGTQREPESGLHRFCTGAPLRTISCIVSEHSGFGYIGNATRHYWLFDRQG